jgi:hypothetical protein
LLIGVSAIVTNLVSPKSLIGNSDWRAVALGSEKERFWNADFLKVGEGNAGYYYCLAVAPYSIAVVTIK